MICVGIDIAKTKRDCSSLAIKVKSWLISRLVTILFLGLEKFVPHFLVSYPAHNVSSRLSHLYGKLWQLQGGMLPSNSVGPRMPAKSLELRHTVQLIQKLDVEIEEIGTETNSI